MELLMSFSLGEQRLALYKVKNNLHKIYRFNSDKLIAEIDIENGILHAISCLQGTITHMIMQNY